MHKFNLKEDGSQWYNYFCIRLDDKQHRLTGKGYYLSWSGKARIAFPVWFAHSGDAKDYVKSINWREAVDAEFEKEVLGE